MKPRIKSTIWYIRKEKRFQSEHQEEKKMRIGLGISGASLNIPASES